MSRTIVRAASYTVDEVAVVLGVVPEQVRRLIRAGDLAATMARRGTGGGYRVSHDDLERYLQAKHSPFVRLDIPEADTEKPRRGW